MTIPERLAWAKYLRTQSAPKSYAMPTKYRNRKIYVDGIRFDSVLESDRFCELKALQAAGEVLYFLRQVPLQIATGVKLVVDFMVVWVGCGDIEIDGETQPYVRITWEDTKGFLTSTARTKIAVANDKYHIKIRILKRADVRKS
jgi:hypothetical protein